MKCEFHPQRGASKRCLVGKVAREMGVSVIDYEERYCSNGYRDCVVYWLMLDLACGEVKTEYGYER